MSAIATPVATKDPQHESAQKDPPSSFPLDVIRELAESMKSVLGKMGPWSIGALTFGLCLLQEVHEEQGVRDFIDGNKYEDKEDAKFLLKAVSLSIAAYYTELEDLKEACAAEEVELLKEKLTAEPFLPAYFIAIDHSQQSILLVVRGTNAISDIITNLSGSFSDHGCGGKSHHGILESANRVLDLLKSELIDLLNEHKGYTLKLMGHSLGAGTASLMCFMINNRPDLVEDFAGHVAECVGIATPPVLEREFADKCTDQITSLVMENDVVPRMSVVNLEKLRMEIESTQWEERLKQEVESQLKPIHELPEKIKSDLERLAKALDPDKQVKDKLQTAAANLTTLGDKAHKYMMESKVGQDLANAFGWDKASSEEDAKVDEENKRKSEDKLHTDLLQLFSPGRIVYLKRQPGVADTEEEEQFSGVSSILDRPERIVVNEKMLSDHFMDVYTKGLNFIIGEEHAS